MAEEDEQRLFTEKVNKTISECLNLINEVVFFVCFFAFNVYGCFVCIYVHVHSWCLQRLENGARSSGTGVKDGCEPPCVCWELNPDPLEEQLVLLNAEPFLQPSWQSPYLYTFYDLEMF